MTTQPSSSSVYLAAARSWITQFPPVEWAIGQVREVLMGALRQGPVPEHVAFVMDGNRRFARNQRIETVEGHNRGFEALARILEVCYKSGVRVVTIYAFSIENYHRSQHEVEGLMGLAKLKLTQLAQHGDLLARYGARIRILGQREMIRADVLEVVERVEALTQNNGDAVLNVCFPYTSRAEITSAVKDVVAAWSQPAMGKERGFSEAHISRAIRSRRLSASERGPGDGDDEEKEEDEKDEKGATSAAPAPSAPSTTTTHLAPPSASTDDGDTASSTRSHSSRGSHRDGATAVSTAASTATLPPASGMLDSASGGAGAGGDGTAAPGSSGKRALPDPESITAATLNAHMLTADDPPLDLLVRTSGVARFSDFMLWQAHGATEVVFARCLWPEFDLWHFLPILVEWQWRRRREVREGMRARQGKRRAEAVAGAGAAAEALAKKAA